MSHHKQASLKEQIENNFLYHSPSENQVDRYKYIRSAAKELAHGIDERCPDSREKSLALTNLEQAVMWANAAIARNGSGQDDQDDQGRNGPSI